MKKRIIISINYNKFLLPEDVNIGEVINTISYMIELDSDGYGANERYIPKEEGVMVEIKSVSEDKIRALSEDEKRDDEIKTLKNSVSYKDTQLDKLKKEMEEIKCINQALCEKEDGGDGEDR